MPFPKPENPNKKEYNSLEEMKNDLSPGAYREVKSVDEAAQRRELERTRRTGEGGNQSPPPSDINRQ